MKKLNIIVPQYHTNFCINNCLYCGFKSSNNLIPRKRLSFEEFKTELGKLILWGYRTIEFVFSSDPYLDIVEIARRIEYAKKISLVNSFDIRIGLNADPLSFLEYKLLKNAGLDFFVLWMETYSSEKFSFWHGNNNPKSDFNYRLNSYNRAIEAGLNKYGMGVMLGLNDWKYDVEHLIQHGRELIKQYGIDPFIIGLPRYKKAHSVTLNGEINKISDQDFRKICKLYKEAFPNSMLFFNTRENLNLNLECCHSGDLFTIDCGTFPGAFLNPEYIENGNEQFHTHVYDRVTTITVLRDKNIIPLYEW